MLHTHNRPCAIAFTGGIDSTVLAYYLCDQLDSLEKEWYHDTPIPNFVRTPLTILACNYSQKTFERTDASCRFHVRELNRRYSSKVDVTYSVLDVKLPPWSTTGGLFKQGYSVPEADEMPNHGEEVRRYADCYVDGLNVILYSWMMSFLSMQKINLLYTGHQFEVNEWDNYDGYKYRTDDSTPFFLDRMNIMNECGFSNRVRIEAPFSLMRLSKYDIVALGRKLNVDFSKTFSCQFEPACGKCDNCLIRRKAFGQLAILGA